MVLNMDDAAGEVLLTLVDAEADRLLAEIPKLPAHDKALAIIRLQHVGVLKHRLEANLWYPDPFKGPGQWGYPRRRRARADRHPGLTVPGHAQEAEDLRHVRQPRHFLPGTLRLGGRLV